VRDFKSFRFRYLFQENIMEHDLTHQKEEKYAELIFNFCSGQTYYPNSLVEHYSNDNAPTGASCEAHNG